MAHPPIKLEIKNKKEYNKVKDKLLDILHKTRLSQITMKDRGPTIGLIGKSNHFGYGFRRFKGWGELSSNTKHPELFKCLTEFGNLVVPKDWTYNTITLNEGVKALKHKDKMNNGSSVLIGIGNFTKGGIKVWDAEDKHPKVYNLHNVPLLFNGAELYHETAPFTGERYTMIFYKQKKEQDIPGIVMRGKGDSSSVDSDESFEDSD